MKLINALNKASVAHIYICFTIFVTGEDLSVIVVYTMERFFSLTADNVALLLTVLFFLSIISLSTGLLKYEVAYVWE